MIYMIDKIGRGMGREIYHRATAPQRREEEKKNGKRVNIGCVFGVLLGARRLEG